MKVLIKILLSLGFFFFLTNTVFGPAPVPSEKELDQLRFLLKTMAVTSQTVTVKTDCQVAVGFLPGLDTGSLLQVLTVANPLEHKASCRKKQNRVYVNDLPAMILRVSKEDNLLLLGISKAGYKKPAGELWYKDTVEAGEPIAALGIDGKGKITFAKGKFLYGTKFSGDQRFAGGPVISIKTAEIIGISEENEDNSITIIPIDTIFDFLIDSIDILQHMNIA